MRFVGLMLQAQQSRPQPGRAPSAETNDGASPVLVRHCELEAAGKPSAVAGADAAEEAGEAVGDDPEQAVAGGEQKVEREEGCMVSAKRSWAGGWAREAGRGTGCTGRERASAHARCR